MLSNVGKTAKVTNRDSNRFRLTNLMTVSQSRRGLKCYSNG